MITILPPCAMFWRSSARFTFASISRITSAPLLPVRSLIFPCDPGSCDKYMMSTLTSEELQARVRTASGDHCETRGFRKLHTRDPTPLWLRARVQCRFFPHSLFEREPGTRSRTARPRPRRPRSSRSKEACVRRARHILPSPRMFLSRIRRYTPCPPA